MAKIEDERGVGRSVSVAPEGRVILGGPDSDLRRALASAIRADGCDVIEVSDAVLLLGQVEFSLSAVGPRPRLVVVITDMGLIGLEILGILGRIYRGIPALFVTASGSERIMVQARRLGASGVFAAPVDVDVLKRAVRAAMPR